MTRYTPLWLQAGSYAASIDRRLIGALWPTAATTGLAVTASGSSMSVTVAAGTAAIPAANGTGSVLCTSDANETVTLDPAPASGTNRIDLVICQARGNDLDNGTNNDFVFTFAKGTAVATPVAPAVPAGALALASVYVAGGSAAVTQANITDIRPFGLPVSSASGVPPPLGAGAPFSSFTAADGDVWVAKGGVYSGAWKRARDVLACQYYRTAALTGTTGVTTFTHDTKVSDLYGIYSAGHLTIPLAGIWHIEQQVCFAPSAVGQFLDSNLYIPSLSLNRGAMTGSTGTPWLTALTSFDEPLAAGADVQTQLQTSPALGINVGRGLTWMAARYVGTG